MTYKLCMAEKPSVGKDIARVLGATKKYDGYMQGNGYIVTWAVGHLVCLAEPEDYGYVPQSAMYSDDKAERKAAREKAYEEIPLMPEEFKLVVNGATRKQFEIIKELLHRDDVDEVINCGDMGPEGHVLQWLIREKAGCDKPVSRFCATSMTDEAIREAITHPRREEEFANIVKGEFAKKQADWMLGMSLSRCATIKYGRHIAVGRVQSPTLYFIVKRYLEVKDFKVTDYYGFEARLSEGFSVFWNKDTENVFPESAEDGAGRLLDEQMARNKAEAVKAAETGVVTSAQTKKRGKNPPQLYDITELERDANNRYGYSAALTLATAQALYETQKVLTYPRTDSRYITSDLAPYMKDRIRAIGKIDDRYKTAADMLFDGGGMKITKRIVDDSKVSDHHAILPTKKIDGFDPSAMAPLPDERKKGVTAESMRNVLDLVLARTVVAFADIEKYEQTDVAVKFGDITFTAAGGKVLDPGFLAIQEFLCGKDEEEAPEAAQAFPELEEGRTVGVTDCIVKSKKTTPPKLHTEATLLTAMENAGNSVEGGEVLKGRGIGTQATRANIIEKLFTYKYCEKKGKSILPTATGINIIAILPDELTSPKMTADWENRIAEIADGNAEPEEFINEFKEFLKEETDRIKNTDTGVSFYNPRPKCPWCGAELRRFEDKKKYVKYYCRTEGCGFALRTDEPPADVWLGRKLKEDELVRLIAGGSVTLSGKKKGSTRGRIKVQLSVIRVEKGDKVYSNIKAASAK